MYVFVIKYVSKMANTFCYSAITHTFESIQKYYFYYMENSKYPKQPYHTFYTRFFVVIFIHVFYSWQKNTEQQKMSFFELKPSLFILNLVFALPI